MDSRWLALLLVALACVACASDKKAKQEPAASQVEAPFEAVDLDPETGVAALAGSWSGNTEVKGYGMAKAVLIVDREGNGSYYGSLSGVPQNGTFRIGYWDGQWLEAATLGYRERVRGRLLGNQLHLELPYVGSVILYRASK